MNQLNCICCNPLPFVTLPTCYVAQYQTCDKYHPRDQKDIPCREEEQRKCCWTSYTYVVISSWGCVVKYSETCFQNFL